jgi:hypothetical protein
MPIAELLGVQLDMQLLLKLSLSVASVLLVSWAYRFYSSRASRAKACLPPTGDTLPPDAAPLGTGDPPDGGRDRSGGALEGATDGRDLHKNRRSLAHPADAGERTSDRTGRPLLSDAKHRRAGTERAADPARDNREGEAAAQKGPAEGSTGNGSARSDTLSPPGPGEGGPDEASGRHSPCVLQRREPSLGPVGVGRELRQDVDHQGAQSSFLSKAEIQVADAHLVPTNPLYPSSCPGTPPALEESWRQPGPRTAAGGANQTKAPLTGGWSSLRGPWWGHTAACERHSVPPGVDWETG